MSPSPYLQPIYNLTQTNVASDAQSVLSLADPHGPLIRNDSYVRTETFRLDLAHKAFTMTERTIYLASAKIDVTDHVFRGLNSSTFLVFSFADVIDWFRLVIRYSIIELK